MLQLTQAQWDQLAENDADNFADATTNEFLLKRPEMKDDPGAVVVAMRMRSAYTHAMEFGFTDTAHIVKLMYLAADAPEFFRIPIVDRQIRKP